MSYDARTGLEIPQAHWNQIGADASEGRRMAFDARCGRYVAGDVQVDGAVMADARADRIRSATRELDRELTDSEIDGIAVELLDPVAWAHLSAADRGVDDPADADGPDDDPVGGRVIVRSDATPETAEGIERRYFAGVHSLVDRAEFRPECCWQKIEAPAGDAGEMPYHDYDLEVGVVVGDDPADQTALFQRFGRWARAEFTFGIHVCESGRLETHPLYVEEDGWIDVRSRADTRARAEVARRDLAWDETEPLPGVAWTRFALRPQEIAPLKARVLLVLAGRWLGEGLPR